MEHGGCGKHSYRLLGDDIMSVKKQVFISYHREDTDFVQELARDLNERLPDVSVVYDTVLPAGASFVETLFSVIKASDVVLAVLSPSYIMSHWATREMNIAIERSLNSDARLIPIILRPCKPHGYISMLRAIDFTKKQNEALTDLIWGITGEQPLAAAPRDHPGDPAGKIDPAELRAVQNENRAFAKNPERNSDTPKELYAEGHHCFVIMPFTSPDLQFVYDEVVAPEARKYGRCERGDDPSGSNVIMEDILGQIRSCTYAIADLTGQNANVFYELGICHALGKPVLLLAQSTDDLPFDLRHRRVQIYQYSPPGIQHLKARVASNLQEMLTPKKRRASSKQD
jgi:hypothetical protein